jgi:hydrogenase maturation factor HypF (carbamoyltransferase family)
LINKYNEDEDTPEGCQLRVIPNKRKWYVDFPYKIIYNYINEQSQHICDNINKIIDKNENIKTIIFVGGYSLNDILISLIKETLRQRNNFNFFTPPKPFLAVMEGSVIFGIIQN